LLGGGLIVKRTCVGHHGGKIIGRNEKGKGKSSAYKDVKKHAARDRPGSTPNLLSPLYSIFTNGGIERTPYPKKRGAAPCQNHDSDWSYLDVTRA